MDTMTYYETQVRLLHAKHFPDAVMITRVARAKQYMDVHACEPVDLAMLASLSCLSKFHFIRLFKRCYGRTPHQYLTERRMDAAMRLLMQGTTVIDTCMRVGFESAHSFSVLFKRYTGVSPSAFEKKQFSIRSQSNSFPVLLIK